MAISIAKDRLKPLTKQKIEELTSGGEVKGRVEAHKDPITEALSGVYVLTITTKDEEDQHFCCDDLLQRVGILAVDDVIYVSISIQDKEVQLKWREPHVEKLCGKNVAHRQIA